MTLASQYPSLASPRLAFPPLCSRSSPLSPRSSPLSPRSSPLSPHLPLPSPPRLLQPPLPRVLIDRRRRKQYLPKPDGANTAILVAMYLYEEEVSNRVRTVCVQCAYSVRTVCVQCVYSVCMVCMVCMGCVWCVWCVWGVFSVMYLYEEEVSNSVRTVCVPSVFSVRSVCVRCVQGHGEHIDIR